MGLPFYTVYALEELRFSMGDVTVLTTLTSLGGLASLRTWGALSDRFGNKPVLITCALLWSSSALALWLFAGPQRYTHLYANYFITGFMTAGFQLCQFNLMIKLVPTESKSHYISVFLAFTSFLTALGPLVGARLLAWIPRRLGVFLGQPLMNYHVLFAGSLLLCLVSINILQIMREPAERPWRELARVMRNMREFNPVLGLASLAQYMFTPRGLGRLARQSVRSLRRQTSAVSEVGEELVEQGLRVLKQPFERDDPGDQEKKP
jgi:MFS family permease